jgi:hypothetical protein
MPNRPLSSSSIQGKCLHEHPKINANESKAVLAKNSFQMFRNRTVSEGQLGLPAAQTTGQKHA